MKTFSIDELYDSHFIDTAPYGEEYSDFGFLKNLFPAHTIVGKIVGSTNHSKGIELGDLLKKKKRRHKPKSVSRSAPVQKTISTKQMEKTGNNKKYMMIGGGILLLIVIVAMFMMMRKK